MGRPSAVPSRRLLFKSLISASVIEPPSGTTIMCYNRAGRCKIGSTKIRGVKVADIDG